MAPARIRGVPDSPSSLGEDSTSPLLHLVHTPFWLLEGSSSHSTSDASSSLGVPSYYDSSACTASYVPLGCALSTAAGLIVARTLAPSTLELSSLPVPGEASAPTPLRLHFPAPLLPHPCLRIDAHGNLHILAATSAALHRVTLPPSALGALGMGDVAPQPLLELKDEWCFEVALENAHRVCVVDEARIVVASSAGIALMQQRIDASGEFINDWRTQPFRAHSFLRVVSRLFTRSTPSSPSQPGAGPSASSSDDATALALCAHFEPDVMPALAFSVGVEAKLRIWDVGTGACARVQELPSSASRRAAEHQPLEALPVGANVVIRTYPAPKGVRVLVFVPTAPRRFFALYDVEVLPDAQGAAAVGEVLGVWARDEADETRRLQLADARLDGSGAEARLWAVWEGEGACLASLPIDEGLATLEEAQNAAAVEMDETRGWISVPATPAHPPLHGAAFEAALTTAPDVPGFFMQRLLHAGRFTPYFPEALEAHLHAAQNDSRPPTLRPGVSLSTAQEVAACVGANVQLTTDPATGAWQTDAFAAAVRREWTAFARTLEASARSAAAPLVMLPNSGTARETAPPALLLAGGVAAACEPDPAPVLARFAELERAAFGARGRAVPRAVAAREQLAQRILNAQVGDMDTVALRNVLLLVGTAARLEASLPPGTGDVLAEATRKRLLSAADQKVAGIAWELAQALELSDGDLNELLGDCAQLGDDLEPTLWSLGDVLVGGSRVSELEQGPTRLSTALVADAALRSLQARRSLARANAMLLLALTASEELPHGMDQASLEVLTARALCTLNDIEAFAALAALSAEREIHQYAASAEDEAAMVRHFEALNVGSELADGPAANLLHLLFLRGVLGADAGPEQASEAAADAIVASGVLGPQPVGSASAQASADSTQASGVMFRDEPYLTKPLALMAHSLLGLGHASAALNLLERYPACAAASYLRARALVMLAAFDEASLEFHRVVPTITTSELLEEDESPTGVGLAALLPPETRNAGSEADTMAWYHAHVSDLFAGAGAAVQSAQHAVLALEVELPGTPELFTRVFNAHVASADFTAAHDAVLQAPNEGLRTECLKSLVGVMCDAGEAAKLIGLPFPGLQADVERTLAFKARNSDPIAERNFYRILYAFHMQRGDLKGAGAVMYQHAHSLEALQRRLGTASDDFAELAVHQARSYLAAINALALIDPRNAWFANSVPPSKEAAHARRNGGKGALGAYLPADMFQPGADEVRIVRLDDLRREYTLVLAHLELLQIYPEFMRAGSRIDAPNAVLLYSRNGQFDKAIAAARALDVDQSGIFDSLAIKCVGLARSLAARRAAEGGKKVHPVLAALRDDEDADADAGEAAFLLASERSAHWEGPAADRAWRYLRLHLEAEDTAAVQWRYRVATLDRIIQLGAIDLAPSWLLGWFTENKPDLLVSTCLRYGLIDEALKHAIVMVERTTSHQTSGLASTTWLPYSILDALLVQAEDPSSRPAAGSPSAVRTRELAHKLRAALSARVETLSKRQSEMRRVQNKDARAAAERREREGERDDMEWRPDV